MVFFTQWSNQPKDFCSRMTIRRKNCSCFLCLFGKPGGLFFRFAMGNLNPPIGEKNSKQSIHSIEDFDHVLDGFVKWITGGFMCTLLIVGPRCHSHWKKHWWPLGQIPGYLDSFDLPERQPDGRWVFSMWSRKSMNRHKQIIKWTGRQLDLLKIAPKNKVRNQVKRFSTQEYHWRKCTYYFIASRSLGLGLCVSDSWGIHRAVGHLRFL